MKRRRKDSGFAMLFVFLMAACVAITLYTEIPRVAFEAERQRELLLVDRGNQFKRAIQVFVTDKTNNPMHRYPSSIDELESFNGHRYLRHKYVDPMTGKDEWRLVHINGGVLTDSVTTQAQSANGAPGGTGTAATPAQDFISTQAFLDTGGANGQAAGGVQRALNRRPSDTQGSPGGTPDPNNPGGTLPVPGGVSGFNGNPQNGQPQNGLPPGMPVIPGLGQGGGLQGALPGQPPNTNTQQQAPAANCFIGDCGASTASNQPNGQIPGQLPGQQAPNGIQPGGAPGFGVPNGANGNGVANQQSAAASMIGNLLTTPRPGGMPSTMPGATVGGGLAGVASSYESEGIMVINQRTKINEWEYIFDQTKYRAPPNPVTGPQGTPQPAMGQGTTGTPIGNNGMNGPGGTPTTPPANPNGGGGGGQ
jgi:hypothetical protein